MKVGGKVQVPVDESDPVARAAIATIKSHLKHVRGLFAKAATRHEGDADVVHHLRVATRRAAAALELYEQFLAHKRAKKIRKLLNTVRRTAGQARDCDVLLARLDASDERTEATAFRKRIRALRRKAQHALCALYERGSTSDRLKRWTRALLARTARKAARRPQAASQPFRDWAPVRLRDFWTQFVEAASPHLDDVDALHEFRIRTKALRYAMELVAPAFPGEFLDALYPSVERLQSLLGAINDESTILKNVARRLASEAEAGDGDALKGRLAQEQRRLADLEREFEAWWTPDRRERLSADFERCLGREFDLAAHSKNPDPSADSQAPQSDESDASQHRVPPRL